MQNIAKASLVTQIVIVLTAAVQFILGFIFLFAPGFFPKTLHLPLAPAWTDWMFAMFAARAFGFGYGSLIALKDLRKNASWLSAMILVQAVDWIATIYSVLAGKVTIMQVSTASFFPLIIMITLALELRRQQQLAQL